MADPAAREHPLRRRQDERTVAEDFIKRHFLDLDCQTIRKGTPHTLLCTKNDRFYQHELGWRKKDEEMLRKLEALWSPAGSSNKRIGIRQDHGRRAMGLQVVSGNAPASRSSAKLSGSPGSRPASGPSGRLSRQPAPMGKLFSKLKKCFHNGMRAAEMMVGSRRSGFREKARDLSERPPLPWSETFPAACPKVVPIRKSAHKKPHNLLVCRVLRVVHPKGFEPLAF